MNLQVGDEQAHSTTVAATTTKTTTTTITMTSQQKPVFVWIQYGNGRASKVSTTDCLDVDDLIKAIIKELSPELNDVPVHKINLYTSNDQNVQALFPDEILSDVLSLHHPIGSNARQPFHVRIIQNEKPTSTDQSIHITLEQIKHTQDYLAHSQESLIKKQDYLTKLNTLVIEQYLDPWRGTSERTQHVNDELTKAVLKYYNYGRFYCMIVGYVEKKASRDFVKTAHLWPHSTHGQGLSVLGINSDDVDSPQNCLRLHHDIERAFDAKRLTFELVIKTDESSQLKLVLVDHSLSDTLIGSVGRSFGQVNGSLLHFRNDKRPFHRVLALHYRATMTHAIKKRWIDESNLSECQIHYQELISHTLKHAPIGSLDTIQPFKLI